MFESWPTAGIERGSVVDLCDKIFEDMGSMTLHFYRSLSRLNFLLIWQYFVRRQLTRRRSAIGCKLTWDSSYAPVEAVWDRSNLNLLLPRSYTIHFNQKWLMCKFPEIGTLSFLLAGVEPKLAGKPFFYWEMSKTFQGITHLGIWWKWNPILVKVYISGICIRPLPSSKALLSFFI